MSVDLEPELKDRSRPESPDTQMYQAYRALSTTAVVSLVVGAFSVVAFLDWSLAVVPILGIILALRARRQIRRYPDEFSGLNFANAGLGMSAAFLVLGLSFLSYIYATEVPPGYERISYSQLQSDESKPHELIPESAKKLEGKKVFIKGYMFPGVGKENIRTFVLVRDNGDCCFGGAKPKLSDMIQISFKEPLRADYTTRVRKLAGVFHVAPSQGVDDVGSVLYQLEADYVR